MAQAFSLLGRLLILLGYLAGLAVLIFVSVVSGVQTLILTGILHALYAIWEQSE